MSFPAARWRWQLIGRGRGPRAGLGASLAAAGAQLSGKNWGGCCGEISYRSLGGAAGPRSALTGGVGRGGPPAEAHHGEGRRGGGGRGRGGGRGGGGRGGGGGGGGASPPPPLFPHPPRALPVALLSPLAFVPTPRGWAPPPTTPLRPVRPPPARAGRQGIGRGDRGGGWAGAENAPTMGSSPRPPLELAGGRTNPLPPGDRGSGA